MKKLWLLILCASFSLNAADSAEREERVGRFGRKKEPSSKRVREFQESNVKKNHLYVTPYVTYQPFKFGFGVSLRLESSMGFAGEVAPMIFPKTHGYWGSPQITGFSCGALYYFSQGRFKPYIGMNFTQYQGDLVYSPDDKGIYPIFGIQFKSRKFPIQGFLDFMGPEVYQERFINNRLLLPRLGVGAHF